MSALLTPRGLAFALLVSAMVGTSQAQLLVDELTVPSEKGAGSFEVWANHRSNALSSGFLHTFQQGGFLDRAFFEDMLDAHPTMGAMGGQAGWSKRFSTRPLGEGPWALTGAVGSEVLVSTLWRKEILELAFLGNAGHTGRVDVFNGTGFRMGAFNRFSIGMEHKDTRQRLELSLVQRVAGVEWGIPRGSFWVSEAADSMLPSYGVGLSGALPLTSEEYPIQFLVDFQDVGIMWERSGGLVALADTGFRTTGLAVPFTEWIGQDGGMDMGLTWQDVVDGDTGIDPDSLYFFSDSAIGRMQMLPTRIQAQLSWWPTADLQVRAKVRAGSWMPRPEFTMGVGWIPSKRLAFGVDYRTGGWGLGRPVTWLDLRVTEKRILSIEVDDPMGWSWGTETASNTYGRGVRVSLRRIAGAGWTRLMGLPSKPWREAPPNAAPSLPETSSRP
jgi:hypothetical protein